MERKRNMKLGTRLLVLLCMMAFGLVLLSIASVLLAKSDMLIQLTAQDILVFIVPAVAAMAIFYRRPLHAMQLDRAPSWRAIMVVVLFYFLSLPAMNWLVEFNKSMALPASLSAIEEAMRVAEDAAAELTEDLLSFKSVGMLIACTLVVGFMAGLSEEMLFRGAMLRTMQDSRLGPHAAVWIVAILFSAFHLQFYGFIPRMVLGAWLGYLLVWTRSLWVPIIAHTLNNSTVVVLSYLANIGVVDQDMGDTIGLPADGAFPWLALCSLVACLALALWAGKHITHSEKKPQI